MFSNHKRRAYNNAGNNHNKNSAVGLDEKGIQDSLKAAQVIFQRHSNDTTIIPTPTHIPKDESIGKKQPQKLQSRSSTPTLFKNGNSIPSIAIANTSTTNTTTNSINNKTNIPNQINKRQQHNGEISRPTSRQTNRRLHDFPERDRLRQPSPLPVSARASRSPSPSSGSGSSSRSASGSPYFSIDRFDSLNNTSQQIPEKEVQTSKTYKENNEVANIAASLAQKHIDSHIEPKKPSNVISGIVGHNSKNKSSFKHSLKENAELVDALLEKSKLENQRQESWNKNYDPRDILMHNIPTQRKTSREKIIPSPPPPKYLPMETRSYKDDNSAPPLKQEPETMSLNSHVGKHHRIPPPILINSEAVESLTSQSQNSLTHDPKVTNDGNTIDDINSSMTEYDSDDRSDASWDEGDDGDKNDTDEDGDDGDSYYVDGYNSGYIEPSGNDKSFQNLSGNYHREDSQLSGGEKSDIHAYYSNPEKDEDESEGDDYDDLFTLESPDESNIPLSFYSDNDDLYNQEGQIQSPPKSKGKRKKVRRLGKILKATRRKVYLPEPSHHRDTRPVNGPVRLKETMRYGAKKSFNEDKPWKRHRDVKYIEEHDRKRYEGVWVRNRFSYLNLLSWWPHDSPEDGSDESTKVSTMETENIQPLIDLPEDGLILNLVVKAIWERSNLPDEILFQIYKLVDTRGDSTLDRRSFIVGMWLVDQCLYGRKLPDEVPSMVWDSVDSYTMNLIQSRIEMESYQKKKKSKRKLMKRELKHIKHGMKHVHL